MNGVLQSGVDQSATAESRVRANWSNRFTVIPDIKKYPCFDSELEQNRIVLAILKFNLLAILAQRRTESLFSLVLDKKCPSAV